ncbi:Glycosyltransferase involved in cell wall bisynthesis [Novosphingobium sp. CF614]|uniref:glycosyltransferase n=1 Tax=Novosphingobium sp. CF614 TaxID=1884364 RepID=UPI0008E62514|nr:glycosyltransferase [Novosphingobium sp. CF614]SFG19672.1 Glycosyltransferase involved in cell wall bisynthesis [Novosphingobium sp. CF614]
MTRSLTDFDVSVVIPLYNHAHYIRPAIESVLAQTLPPREIIVIDDGSHDEGLEVARQALAGFPAATVVAQANVGAHNTINRCIGMARSRFVAVLNSDDQFEPGKLERCARLWEEDPDLDLVFGDVNLIDDEGAPVYEGPTIDWLRRARDFLRRTNRLDLALANENFAVTTSNFVFTKRIWEHNGAFQALRYCHDLEFVFATLRNGQVLYDANVPHIRYRVHASNTIKEYVNKVRVEIAGVLACALDGGLLMDTQDQCDARTVALFDKALSDKGLGNLVSFLSARLTAFGGDRAAFFDWVINDPQVNDVLLKQVEGSLSAEAFEPLPARSVYRAGVEAPPATKDIFDNPAERRLANFYALLDDVARGSSYKDAALNKSVTGPIVVELTAFDRGGLEKVVLDTSVVLRDLGLDSIIVSCGKVGHLGAIAREREFTVYELSQDDPRGHYRKILRDHGVSLAISHFSRMGYKVFRELGIPNLTFIHNVYAFLNGEALENFRQDDAFVDRYISVSPKATDYATSRLGIDRGKIVTMPNGLLIDEHVARARAAEPVTRAQFGIREDDYVFLNVASYNLHKNHYLMADAMRMLLRKTDRVRIVCIGNTIVPHHIQALRDHLEATGVADHMLLPGYFPDVAPFHAIADAFLLPSLIEGWSIAMNEAMFFGKPMILSDTGGSSEVIVDGDIGILLPNEYGPVSNLHSELLDDIAYNRRQFRTSPFLARAMFDFAEDPGRWREAGLKGHRRLLENYDFVEVVRSYLPIFEDVINCTRSAHKTPVAGF